RRVGLEGTHLLVEGHSGVVAEDEVVRLGEDEALPGDLGPRVLDVLRRVLRPRRLDDRLRSPERPAGEDLLRAPADEEDRRGGAVRRSLRSATTSSAASSLPVIFPRFSMSA